VVILRNYCTNIVGGVGVAPRPWSFVCEVWGSETPFRIRMYVEAPTNLSINPLLDAKFYRILCLPVTSRHM
jgi:hypothetical protein